MEEVRHVEIDGKMSVGELVRKMRAAGVMGGGTIGKAVDILEEMVKDKECKVFLGLAGAMVPGGMKKIIIDMLRSGLIDVFVTTGANLTHDIIESLGHNHFQGRADVDDVELEKKGIDRIYDVFMKDCVYEDLDNFIISLKDKFEKKKMNIKEFLWEIGKNVKSEDSILRVCYEKKIPVFCPAISDSGLGQMSFMNLINRGVIEVGAFGDLSEIQDIAWTAKKIGVIYLGGGVPKNYIQQAMQFMPTKANELGGANYGVQITMDRAEPGGSSGAPLREGLSWGKMNPGGKHVTVICDVTIALPLIYGALKERV
ncbi:MAG: deoxyhypusine synthase [Candidatus Woesearchaeota archaeon]